MNKKQDKMYRVCWIIQSIRPETHCGHPCKYETAIAILNALDPKYEPWIVQANEPTKGIGTIIIHDPD